MDGDEESREDPEEAVHIFDREAGQTGDVSPVGEENAREHARRDEQVGDDPACPGGIPRGRRRYEKHARASLGCGQSPARTVADEVMNRPWRPRASSQAGPSSPRRNAAFAATSAARHVAAHAVTHSQGTTAGAPSQDRSGGGCACRPRGPTISRSRRSWRGRRRAASRYRRRGARPRSPGSRGRLRPRRIRRPRSAPERRRPRVL